MRTLLVLALVVAATRAQAEEVPNHPALKDRFYFGAGAFFPQTSTQAAARVQAGPPGHHHDLEQTLDMERSKTVPTVLRPPAHRRALARRGRVLPARPQQRVAARPLAQWGEQTFPVNADVSARFDFSDLRVSAGYSFFRTADKELGVGLGLHMVFVRHEPDRHLDRHDGR